MMHSAARGVAARTRRDGKRVRPRIERSTKSPAFVDHTAPSASKLVKINSSVPSSRCVNLLLFGLQEFLFFLWRSADMFADKSAVFRPEAFLSGADGGCTSDTFRASTACDDCAFDSFFGAACPNSESFLDGCASTDDIFLEGAGMAPNDVLGSASDTLAEEAPHRCCCCKAALNLLAATLPVAIILPCRLPIMLPGGLDLGLPEGDAFGDDP